MQSQKAEMDHVQAPHSGQCHPARKITGSKRYNIQDGLNSPTVIQCPILALGAVMDTERAHRKLTTIMATDAVGYSHLMATREEATLATLKIYRELIVNFVQKHGGRVFNTAGDAVLAEFGSAVEAVRCAVSIQEDLRVRNAQLGEDEQLWFRIGINVGDVMIEDGDLFGDGVNVAARLEGLAEKGGICISGSTFEQVKNKLSVAFSDIGPQKVKNIPEPVSAFRLVPGEVSVVGGAPASKAAGESRAGNTKKLSPTLIGAAAALVVVGGVAGWRYVNYQPASAYPFDGRWTVYVTHRSGCLTNEDTDYPLFVEHGVIDQAKQRLPKKGAVSPDGHFKIEVFDSAGHLMNSQEGTIAGDMGTGKFTGLKPSCTGQVELKRAG